MTDLSLQKVAANTKVETLEKKLETEKKAKSDAERRVLEEKTRAKRTVEEEVTKFMSDMAKKLVTRTILVPCSSLHIASLTRICYSH